MYSYLKLFGHNHTDSQRKTDRLTMPECCPEGLPERACWTDSRLTEWFRLSVDYREEGEKRKEGWKRGREEREREAGEKKQGERECCEFEGGKRKRGKEKREERGQEEGQWKGEQPQSQHQSIQKQ